MSNIDSTYQERHVLVINDGKRRAIALDAAAYSIGRDPSNAIVLNIDTISRQHAMLLRVPIPGTKQYRYRLLDGNAQGKPSANGVFVGNKACQTRDLENGDVIRFGQILEASYLTVSMGDAEFTKYLESIAYHSIKSDTVNAKETLVAACLDDEATSISITYTQPKETARERPPVVPWAETLHENSPPVQESIQQPSQQTSQQSSPYRLWMIVIPGIMLLGGGIAAAWFAASFRPTQSVAEPVAPSQSKPVQQQ